MRWWLHVRNGLRDVAGVDFHFVSGVGERWWLVFRRPMAAPARRRLVLVSRRSWGFASAWWQFVARRFRDRNWWLFLWGIVAGAGGSGQNHHS